MHAVGDSEGMRRGWYQAVTVTPVAKYGALRRVDRVAPALGRHHPRRRKAAGRCTELAGWFAPREADLELVLTLAMTSAHIASIFASSP